MFRGKRYGGPGNTGVRHLCGELFVHEYRSGYGHGGGPFPAYDLVISSTTLHAPGVVVIGQTGITMTVDVTNSGPNASRPAKLRVSNVILSIPVLEPNETVTFERQRVGYARLGTTTYRACIEEAPGEENTGNNCASRSVTYRLQ